MIYNLLLDLAQKGHPIHLQKVKSHVGILGNKAADMGAKFALQFPRKCGYNLSGIGTSDLASLYAWPCAPLPVLPGLLPRGSSQISQPILNPSSSPHAPTSQMAPSKEALTTPRPNFSCHACSEQLYVTLQCNPFPCHQTNSQHSIRHTLDGSKGTHLQNPLRHLSQL
jgi:hypothetical protein